MKNTERVTYWQKIGQYTTMGTHIIYKYYGDSKPLNWRTDWMETTAYMYEKNLAMAAKKYAERMGH